jgi:hypothetical protein
LQKKCKIDARKLWQKHSIIMNNAKINYYEPERDCIEPVEGYGI